LIRNARARAAIVVGAGASFVAAAAFADRMGPALFLDPDAAWAFPRLLLGLGLAAAAAFAGAAAASVFFVWSGTPTAQRDLPPLPLSRGALVALAATALAVGVLLRFVWLASVPDPLWLDDVSLIDAALALRGTPGDFADPLRPVPAEVPKPYGSVGVLYLELYRLSLRLAGTTVLGVRLPSAVAGAAAVATAMLLARALLPAGGAALAGLVLAGLRWSLILSRWGWVMIALAPIADLAALLCLRARRSSGASPAVAAGAVAGLGAHVYLSAWTVAAALALFTAIPRSGQRRPSARLPVLFLAGFALVVAPLVLFRKGGSVAYFARTRDHSVVLEIRRQKSLRPAIAAAAIALAAPWGPADPGARHDLPGRARLGWIVGVPVAVALGRALVKPRAEFSALLLCHGAAAFLAVVAGGEADQPNGSRFAYLSTLTAVAAAAGTLALAGAVPPGRRRAGALAAVGLLAVSGATGARDALLRWPDRRETFDGFHGQDTLLGRAQARWERYGAVSPDATLAHSPVLSDAIARFGLDPAASGSAGTAAGPRAFRVVRPANAASGRTVERIEDRWGRRWGVVVAEPPR
jgi:hypothetical protein